MRRCGRIALLWALLTLCVLAAVGSSAAAVPVLVVAPGHAFTVTGGGFVDRAPVRVQLVGSSAGRRTVRADGRGRVRVAYRAPTRHGRYRLLLSGASRRAPHRAPAPPSAAPGRDAQVIAVTVPLVIGVPFRVGPGGSGVLGGGLHQGGGGSDGSGNGGLATTGTDLRVPLLLAAGLGVLGLTATLAGRRRAQP